jgi:hypothetical protein
VGVNLTAGDQANYVSNAVGATISGGGASFNPNRITADYATIGGGIGNVAEGEL